MTLRRNALLLLALLLFSGSALPGAAQSASVPVLNPANGHWYQLVRTPAELNWPEARDAARALSFAGYRGHLATITSANERDFINAHVTGKSGLDAVWLGGYHDSTAPDYQEPDRGWRWVTGEPFQYTNWHRGEPNDSPRNSNALQLAVIWGGEWDDRLNGEARLPGYVVEYEPPATPGPPVLGILPNPVIGGQSTVGQVTLDRPAPPGDLNVTLTSGDPATAAVPAVVIVPAGATTALFSIVTFPVAAPTSVTLTATGPGGSRPATLHVLPEGTAIPDANLLVNGGFEARPLAPGQPGAPLHGWRVARGGIDLVHTSVLQPAPDGGGQSLTLVGETPRFGAGTIEQTFPTTPGRDYLFAGWIAHHPANGVVPEGRADVTLDGKFFVQLFHRDALATATAMRWTPFAYRFRATGTATTLAIADVTGPPEQYGLMLDGLSVTLVVDNLLVNGSFEEPGPLGLGNGRRALGPGGLPGWQVVLGPADLVDQRVWQAAPGQGGHSLHLASSPGAAAIEQTVPTEPGRRYVLSGWLSRSPEIDTAHLSIYLDGEPLTALVHSNSLYGASRPTVMRWQPFLVTFRATARTTALRFADASGRGSDGAAALDGLRVVPADESSPGGAPAAPTGLQARLIMPNQVDLAWSDNSGNETDFEIQRRGPTGDWTRIALVAANTTRFIDFAVSPNTAYAYRVQAQNDSGASAWSNELAVTTLPVQ